MKYAHYLIFLIGASLLLSCNNDGDNLSTGTLDPDSVISAWLDSMNITATRDASGIYYYPVTENPSGSAVSQAGQVLAFYYALLDLDSNAIASFQPADGDSLLYKFASNAVFPLGLDVGFGLMRTGETYNFVVPPSQGYADAPSITTADGTGIVLLQTSLVGLFSEDQINTTELSQIDDYIRVHNLNDTISVTIERIDTTFIGNTILSIDTTFNYVIDSVEYFNSGVRYKELVAGMGNGPLNGDTVIIDYSLEYLDGTAITSSSNFTYVIGSGIPDFLIPGLEFGLSLMPPGERALIMIPSAQAYRESARIVPASIIPELIDAAIIPDYVADVEPYRPLVFNVIRTQ